MPLTLNEFRDRLITDVRTASEADKIHLNAAFGEEIKPILQDQLKILDDFDSSVFFAHEHIGKIRKEYVNAASVEDATNQINLLRIEFDPSSEMKTLTSEEIYDYFRCLTGFISNIFETDIHNNHPDSSPEASLVSDIRQNINSIVTINCIIVSNNKLSSRFSIASKEPSITVRGREIAVKLTVLDIERIMKYKQTGQEEPVSIRTKDFGCKGIPYIPADIHSDKYQAYIAVVPGEFLANIYKEYNSRILQGNVRSFLTTRGKINKGIENTIRNEPDKFFSYNNGICTTADSIETENINGKSYIVKFDNLQIINGGQTTATLASTTIKRSGKPVADLSNIYVQMKLTIVNDKSDREFTYHIAEYANSQNKVTSSDLASNHPLYTTLETISQHLYTPQDRYQKSTKWFFERNRGAYEQNTLLMSKSDSLKFKEINPKQQVIKKTDLAKYENSYMRKPYEVSWGAEVNLEDYQEYVKKEYDKDKNRFNQNFYKELVGKAILYKHIGALISDSSWYKENIGYRAQLVTYTFSKLMDVLETKNARFDFMQLWQTQSAPEYLDDLILEIAEKCSDYFYNGEHPEKNISVLCKKEDCWKAIKSIPISVDDAIRAKILISESEYKAKQVAAKHEQKLDNEIADLTLIYRISPSDWRKCLEAGSAQGVLSFKEQDIINLLIKCLETGRNPLSDAQSRVVVEALDKLREAKIFKEEMIPADEDE